MRRETQVVLQLDSFHMQLYFLIACYLNVTTLFLRNSLVFTRLLVVVVEHSKGSNASFCDYSIRFGLFFYIFCCPTIHLSMLGIII